MKSWNYHRLSTLILITAVVLYVLQIVALLAFALGP
jgi:hypothetical protein